MQRQLEQLQSEVTSLRAIVTSLQAEIRQLRELVSGASGPDSPRVAESEFALVSEPPQDRISGLSETRVSIDVPHTGYPPAELSTPELNWETRERIARQIGLFLRGAFGRRDLRDIGSRANPTEKSSLDCRQRPQRCVLQSLPSLSSLGSGSCIGEAWGQPWQISFSWSSQ